MGFPMVFPHFHLGHVATRHVLRRAPDLSEELLGSFDTQLDDALTMADDMISWAEATVPQDGVPEFQGGFWDFRRWLHGMERLRRLEDGFNASMSQRCHFTS